MMYLVDRYFLKKPRIRRFITRLMEGDRVHDIKLIGETMSVHSVQEHGYLRSSRLVQTSALLRDELPVIFNLAGLIGPGDTFVDIGANIGVYSLTLARLGRLHSGTRFYAFEANPATFQRLEHNAERLSIHCHNVAISDHEGVLEFVSGAVSHMFTTVSHSSQYSLDDDIERIPCMRLDDANIKGDSLILKIDVEGQEKEVLDGAYHLFKQKRIKAVYLDGYEDVAVESILLGHGFTLRDGVTLGSKEAGFSRTLALRS